MDNLTKNQYDPDKVSHPGETLLEVIDLKNISQKELAILTNNDKEYINNIIKGKASITHEFSFQLEKALGIPASFWNNSEKRYQESKIID